MIQAGDTSDLPSLALHKTKQQQQTQVQQELDKLETQCDRLNLRKDQLNVQNLSVSGELSELRSAVNIEQSSIAQYQRSALTTAQDHAQALAKLACAVDNLADIISVLHKVSRRILYISIGIY